jgi:undecaprenyl-diphosphatase
MEQLNDQLFLAINAGAHAPAIVVAIAVFLANWLVPLTVLLFAVLWVRKDERSRGELLSATLIMLLGLGVNQLLGMLYFHPRPFMIGLGHQYLPHPVDNSFPSDHATFMWSLGFALLMLGGLRAWALGLIAGGLAVAWARVYVGVHFPFDMAGSLLVALAVCAFARPLHRRVRTHLLPLCNRVYEQLIRLIHLPPALFPRH